MARESFEQTCVLIRPNAGYRCTCLYSGNLNTTLESGLLGSKKIAKEARLPFSLKSRPRAVETLFRTLCTLDKHVIELALAFRVRNSDVTHGRLLSGMINRVEIVGASLARRRFGRLSACIRYTTAPAS